MTLQEYINKLQKFVEENPTSKDATIIKFSLYDRADVIIDDIEISHCKRKLEDIKDLSNAEYSEGNYVMFDNCY